MQSPVILTTTFSMIPCVHVPTGGTDIPPKASLHRGDSFRVGLSVHYELHDNGAM